MCYPPKIIFVQNAQRTCALVGPAAQAAPFVPFTGWRGAKKSPSPSPAALDVDVDLLREI